MPRARRSAVNATAPELGWWIATLIAPGSSWVTGAVIPVDGGQVLDSR